MKIKRWAVAGITSLFIETTLNPVCYYSSTTLCWLSFIYVLPYVWLQDATAAPDNMVTFKAR